MHDSGSASTAAAAAATAATAAVAGVYEGAAAQQPQKLVVELETKLLLHARVKESKNG